jgi:trehalose synthase
MSDVDENAVIVNALQSRASAIVQLSLQEGFGLTVAEAMWKAKPVVATRVGGIPDQIEHGVSGLLLDDPYDRHEFAALLQRATAEPAYAAELGRRARERVCARFLSVRSLYRYAELIAEVAGSERTVENAGVAAPAPAIRW